MAEKYIVNMPEKTTPTDTDLMIIEDAQDTKRMTWANAVKPIKDLVGNLASLTTAHKTSVVGAINEIKPIIDSVDNTVAAHIAEIAAKHIHSTGGNANGRYIRFEDGTQICYQPYAPSSNNATTGTLVTFPASFIDTTSYIVNASTRGVLSASAVGSYVVEFNPVSVSTGYVKILAHSATTITGAGNPAFGYVVAGRWK